MAFRFVIAILGVFAVASQANAACCGAPLPCGLPCGLPYGLSAAAPAPSLLSSIVDLLPAVGKLLAAPSTPALPAVLPLAVPPTQVTNKPDVNIPLPLPAEIPLGRYCTCQRYAMKPTLLPVCPTPCCAPAPPCGCGACGCDPCGCY